MLSPGTGTQKTLAQSVGKHVIIYNFFSLPPVFFFIFSKTVGNWSTTIVIGAPGQSYLMGSDDPTRTENIANIYRNVEKHLPKRESRGSVNLFVWSFVIVNLSIIFFFFNYIKTVSAVEGQREKTRGFYRPIKMFSQTIEKAKSFN